MSFQYLSAALAITSFLAFAGASPARIPTTYQSLSTRQFSFPFAVLKIKGLPGSEEEHPVCAYSMNGDYWIKTGEKDGRYWQACWRDDEGEDLIQFSDKDVEVAKCLNKKHNEQKSMCISTQDAGALPCNIDGYVEAGGRVENLHNDFIGSQAEAWIPDEAYPVLDAAIESLKDQTVMTGQEGAFIMVTNKEGTQKEKAAWGYQINFVGDGGRAC